MPKNERLRNCWLAAAVAGLLVWIFNASFFGGLVMGLITFVLLGNLLVWLICKGRGGPAEDAEVLGRVSAPLPPGDGVLDRAERAVVDAGQAFAAGTVSAVAKGKEALHEMRAEMRQRGQQGDATPDASDEADHGETVLERAEERLEQAGEAVKDAMGALAARGKEALGAVRRKEVGDTPEAGAPSDRVSPAGTAAVATDPAGAARLAPAGGDDLKRIKGVGPALEGLLHENGVTSFAQIAAWGDDEIDHFAALIGRMGGRIRSDDWVGQAKLLAGGGATAATGRMDEGEVS